MCSTHYGKGKSNLWLFNPIWNGPSLDTLHRHCPHTIQGWSRVPTNYQGSVEELDYIWNQVSSWDIHSLPYWHATLTGQFKISSDYGPPRTIYHCKKFKSFHCIYFVILGLFLPLFGHKATDICKCFWSSARTLLGRIKLSMSVYVD